MKDTEKLDRFPADAPDQHDGAGDHPGSPDKGGYVTPDLRQMAEMRVWERAFSAYAPGFSKAEYRRAMDFADSHLASPDGKGEVEREMARLALAESGRELLADFERPVAWLQRAAGRVLGRFARPGQAVVLDGAGNVVCTCTFDKPCALHLERYQAAAADAR